VIDHDTDSPIPRHWLHPAYEETARRRYLARFTRATVAWLEDEGPMPEAVLAGERDD
jgi:hypothetical protein